MGLTIPKHSDFFPGVKQNRDMANAIPQKHRKPTFSGACSSHLLAYCNNFIFRKKPSDPAQALQGALTSLGNCRRWNSKQKIGP
ncbi:hypothetical protein EUGRSUZ_C00293 [Eucalyptus grandis]|uniref:Uncharacterized protein n=2 Tax=Eucalyptus grandis TaxID=71139 RepID=A0ACC3LAS2_EUCGR|nr:hypothetical protein EUGRSUZ_C00293 [Eucalyptus grandis]